LAAADVLVESIGKLDKRQNSPAFRADLLLKVALANVIQSQQAEALELLAQAEKASKGMKNADVFGMIIGYFRYQCSLGLDFEQLMSSFSDGQMKIFEIALSYAAMPFHEIPPRYLDALPCVLQGRLTFCSSKMEFDSVSEETIPVYFDDDKKLCFFDLAGKKLYYAGDDLAFNRFNFYFVTMVEQMPHSPHLYLTDDFQIEEGDVLCDIGAAEANFALMAVDKCSQIHIFEGDEKWNEAIWATFAPYREKTTIINKMVSDVSDEEYLTLDEYFGEQRVDFLKLDVEGAEMKVLKGAQKLLAKNRQIKLCVCTYHRSGDAFELADYLQGLGFKTEFSEGLMVFGEEYDPEWYRGSDPQYPYFRHGLIRAWREA
jgi:hypothetical protein